MHAELTVRSIGTRFLRTLIDVKTDGEEYDGLESQVQLVRYGYRNVMMEMKQATDIL
jgi:hypothetical protein